MGVIRWARWQAQGWREHRAKDGPWRCDCPKCDYSASSRWYFGALLKVWLHIVIESRGRW